MSARIEALHTPEERFANPPEFTFRPHCAAWAGGDGRVAPDQ